MIKDNLFEEYAKIRKEMDGLAVMEEALKKEILAGMEAEGMQKKETDWGNFSVAGRKMWKYTDKVIKMKEAVKIAEVEEQERGLAESSETRYVTYKPIKQ